VNPSIDRQDFNAPIVIVAAVAANGVIGRDNKIPWHLPSDMKHFRAMTMGKPLLMGRKTYQSIGRPLPGRTTIVLSHGATMAAAAGVEVVGDLTTALVLAAKTAKALAADEIILAGGAELFAALIDRVARLHLTLVELSPVGDTFFPAIDWSLWREVRRERHLPQKGDDAAFIFVDFERRA
jgi:dihydrofolate reductase